MIAELRNSAMTERPAWHRPLAQGRRRLGCLLLRSGPCGSQMVGRELRNVAVGVRAVIAELRNSAMTERPAWHRPLAQGRRRLGRLLFVGAMRTEGAVRAGCSSLDRGTTRSVWRCVGCRGRGVRDWLRFSACMVPARRYNRRCSTATVLDDPLAD